MRCDFSSDSGLTVPHAADRVCRDRIAVWRCTTKGGTVTQPFRSAVAVPTAPARRLLRSCAPLGNAKRTQLGPTYRAIGAARAGAKRTQLGPDYRENRASCARAKRSQLGPDCRAFCIARAGAKRTHRVSHPRVGTLEHTPRKTNPNLRATLSCQRSSVFANRLKPRLKGLQPPWRPLFVRFLTLRSAKGGCRMIESFEPRRMLSASPRSV